MNEQSFVFNETIAYNLRNYNSYSCTLQYCKYVESYLFKIKNIKERRKAIKAFKSANRWEWIYCNLCRCYLYTPIKFTKIIFDKLGKFSLKMCNFKLYHLSQCLDKSDPQVYNNICTYIAVIWKQRCKNAIETTSDYTKTIDKDFKIIDLE